MKSQAFIAAALLSTAAAQSQTWSQTFDDTDPLITYSSGWDHQAAVNGPTNGTQSYSISPTASYSFTFTGTGFSICAGKKVDRGTFSVTIDVLAGTGNQTSDSLNNAPACETVFEVENLAPTGHDVVVTNTGTGRASFLTVDSITLDVLVPNASSSAAASSTSSSSSSSSSSSRSSSTLVTGAGASAAAQESSGGGSSTAAIAGGVVAGIVALALVALLWFCCARRRKQRQAVGQEDETRSNPFTDGDQVSNRPMSQIGGAPTLFESTSTQPDQATNMYAAAPPPAIPYAGAYQSPDSSSTPVFDNRYSIMSAAAGGAAPAPSQRTSYASPAPQLPVLTDRSPSPFGAFPVDVQEPIEEDPYGGMESEDESANQHSRRLSEADIVASRKGSHSLKRKPVPEA